jgi:hypothetical protein
MKTITISNTVENTLVIGYNGVLRVYGSNVVVMYELEAASKTYDASADDQKTLLIQNDKMKLRANRKYSTKSIGGNSVCCWVPESHGSFS